MASGNNVQGPTVTWSTLKGTKVMSNDAKDLGEIKEISDNFLRLEKGTISKDRFWVPKYVADAYDGKKLWLLISEKQALDRYLYGEEPSPQKHSEDLENFKVSYGHKTLPDLSQNIKVVEERPDRPLTPEDAADQYKNIRDNPTSNNKSNMG